MNLKKKIKHLERENLNLKLEVLKLKMDIQQMVDIKDWKHPRSCLHNSDPWDHLAG
jgi:hypothetical protein|tara:strand:- start:247 stop:414 length:168 start_codon:yes stop_codon:yes gene_type:complete